MNQIADNIRQRLSLREPLAKALDVVTRLVDKLDMKKPKAGDDYDAYLDKQLFLAQEVCPQCKDFEREFPSFAFSIATAIGKTRLMGACIAYLYLAKGIKHFFVLAPNSPIYTKLRRDFGDTTYEKYVFKGIAEFVNKPPILIDGDNYDTIKQTGGLFSGVEINVFNIDKFNKDIKENKKGAPRMKRFSEILGQSYFEYLSGLDDLVILMDEAHSYHASSGKKAINELHPLLGIEMTATPMADSGHPFKNIVYEYNLAQALADGKYVKIPTIAKRKNFKKGDLGDRELDTIKLEDAISVHEHTKAQLELYAKNYGKRLVKPFILVICKNTQHAAETLHLIEDEMFDGRYKGKVLQIDSTTKGKDEELYRQFESLELPDNKIEIVIHVNMLKEGWDVNNLYTIVPLRAANAPILVEQSIGRGLRLPYGGKRTGVEDVDKLTVIAHENFEAVIERAKDPNSVFRKVSFVELDDEDLKEKPGTVVKVQTVLDLKIEEEKQKAIGEIQRKNAEITTDTRKAVWSVIPDLPRIFGYGIGNSTIRSIEDIAKPEVKKVVAQYAIQRIEEAARLEESLFAEQFAKPRIEEVPQVVEAVVKMYIDNVIPIPRMSVKKEAYKAEYLDFDLDTRMGFELPDLKEIIRVGLVDNEVDTIELQSGRQFDKPLNMIVLTLMKYEEIDYDENSELIYKLAQQAIDAITEKAEPGTDVAKLVSDFRSALAKRIYDQMQDHFVMTPQGYEKPKVLPFSGIVEQHITLNEQYGRSDYKAEIPKSTVPKVVFYGFMKSFYAECKFDSKTEQDFSYVLETDNAVKRWLRPASSQFNIYWGNGAHKYEPDFIVETEDCIYMVETKRANEMKDEDVLLKKKAAEEYCKNATEYNLTNNGKPWKYKLLAHNEVDRTKSFKYLMAV